MTKRKFSDIDENLDFDLDGTINIWLSEKKKEENKKISFKVIKTLVLYKFLAYNWNNLIIDNKEDILLKKNQINDIIDHKRLKKPLKNLKIISSEITDNECYND